MMIITVKEAAELLETSERHVRRLITDGKIAAERRGKKLWDVDAASVTSYANNRPPVGRPLGAISDKPARSKRYGKGTAKAEHARVYQRAYRRQRRAEELN
jgi:excisionase family DNA binding protein